MAVVAMRVRSYQNHDNTISLRWIYSNNMTTIRYLMVVVLVKYRRSVIIAKCDVAK
jgi:hypothetical protein